MTADSESTAVPVKQEELSYEDKLKFCSVIAKPMASRKLAKKVYKLIKKGLYEQLTVLFFVD